jgi:transcriptional regulator with XRE-family HTH domain
MTDLNTFLRLRAKSIRKAYGLSHEEFLKTINYKMTRQNYSNIENGVTGVNIDLIDSVIKYLGVSLKEFLDTEKDIAKEIMLKALEADYEAKKKAILEAQE